MFDLIYANSSFLGHTGYANHSREFFTSLNKLIPVRVRNYAHVNDLSYLTKEQKDMVVYQTWNGPPHEVGTQFNINDYSNILTIVLNETDHYYFYDNYDGPKIAYNVWESTLQPQEYFNKLLEFDQLWVPTEWQRQCSINQGYPSERVFVVPEAVDPDFVPEDVSNKPEEYNDGRFKFIIFGRWDYRKSITEIIKSFLEEFKSNEPVDLILSADNPFSIDGLNSTEERLNHHNLNDPRIKVKHKVSRQDYIKYIKTGHCFLSCAKGEGWNIPLIEAMAVGTPSIYSNWGAQLEFAEGLGHPVKIIGEVPAKFGEGSSFSGNILGNYCEPDFDDLKKVMRHVYENYSECKEKAVEESNIIREKYTWKNSSKIAYKIIENFWNSYSKLSASINNSNRVDFKWMGESEKKIEGRIIEPYTGLNFYRCEINVKKNVNYFFQCGVSVGNKIKYKLFEIADCETNEVLFSKYSDNGNYDLKDIDKERHLKDYYKILPKDNAIAVPLYEIFIDEIYNQNFCSIEKGDVVVDIGSSAGFFSVYAYYKECKVCYSFEPLTSLYNAAKEQLKNIPNLVLENKAVDNFNGKTFIYTDKDDTIGSSLHDPKKKNNNLKVKQECEVINFMDIIKEKNIEKIDYLKIDCEGSEYNIINSIPDDYLKNNIKKIAMEYHYNTDGRLKKILDRLESLGFEVDFRKGCHIDEDLGIVCLWRKSYKEEKLKQHMELYQDQYINGQVIIKGKRDCESRYNALKEVFEKYNRPFTILDIGANFGYYSIRACSEYDAVSVMIESKHNECLQLLNLCEQNNCRNKLTVLYTEVNLSKLEELSKCEHFDVVLALNIIHHFKKEDVEKICEIVTKLGDNLILETPPINDSGSCGKDNLYTILNYFFDKEKQKLGEFPRHTSDTNSKIFWIKTPKDHIKWPYYNFEKLFDNKNIDVERLKNRGYNIIKSNFDFKRVINSRKDCITDWIPGINLTTFVELNGIYPSKKLLIENLKNQNIITNYKWDNSNNDLVFHNFILSGHDLHMIDFDDKLIEEDNIGDKKQLQNIIHQLENKKEIEKINIHFIDGPFAEIKGNLTNNNEYLFEFIDLDNNLVVHKDTLKINHWSRANRKYFTNWLIRIKQNEKVIFEHKLNLNNKNVLISFDTKSIGDTIAWFPYVEEFRKKHKCNIFVSTFWNDFFRGVDIYKNLTIVDPGKTLNNLYASYSIGCYDNNLNKNRYNWRIVPLQKIASDILGIEYKEIITDINFNPSERPIKEKYVTLSEHSTFQGKYYNRENGWQEIIDYLNSIGYKVMVISKEKTKLKNIINMTNQPIEGSMNNIYHSEFFMSVASGPAWISWALRKPVLLISGFTDIFSEFETNCYRVINKDVCNSCYNDVNFPFDRGEWNLCKWKGTERQFECTKTITKEMIIEKINKLLKNLK